MVIVALDSSTETASVALLREGQPVAEYSWLATGRHTAQVLPALDRLCRDAGLPVETWSGVAVATGPGSFNGIRGGIAAAVGLAMSRNIPLVGMGTLDVLAYQAHLGLMDGGVTIGAVLPAGRGELYYAIYRPDRAHGVAGPWSEAARCVGPAAALPDDAAQELGRVGETATQGRLILCGGLPPDLRGQLDGALGEGATWLAPAATLRRASYLALLAHQYLQAGGHDHIETVRPLYLRRVTVTRSRRPFPTVALEEG